MKKIILDLCGGTGAWSKPYADAGYRVHNITLPDYDVRKVVFTRGYLNFPGEGGRRLTVKKKDVYGILAAPPCTMFSLARTTAKTPRNFYVAMLTVRHCLEIIWQVRCEQKLAFWAIENPMGYLRQFLGAPAMTFDPSEFGGDYNKTTDLWGYFNEPKRGKKTRYDSTDKNTRKLPPIPEDYVRDEHMTPLQIRRSITNGSFAEAFFKANP